MFSSAQKVRFRRALLEWYDGHKRDLPWRQDRDPYRVWVSEIMLQQTRVAAVLEHYVRFMERFPTVHKLAAAREQSVLALWSGLGYYHRARRMHQAAKMLVREHGGRFPSRAEEWLELPGIGRYTAAAVASIAFGEAVALVDGNVERVLTRLHGMAARNRDVWESAEALLDRERPGDFNQAMMELGATVCTPKAPQCLVCPVRPWCVTQGEGIRSAQTRRKRKQLCYGLMRQGNAVFLVQRGADARLMAGMWELPEIAAPADGNAPLCSLQHSITDTDYAVLVFEVNPEVAAAGKWLGPEQWSRLALTGLTRKILKNVSQQSQVSRLSSAR